MNKGKFSGLEEPAHQQQASLLAHAQYQVLKRILENPLPSKLCVESALTYHDAAKATLSEAEYREFRSLIKLGGGPNMDMAYILSKLSLLLQNYPDLMEGFGMFLSPALNVPFQCGIFPILHEIESRNKKVSAVVKCEPKEMSKTPSEEQMEASSSSEIDSNLSQNNSLDKKDPNSLKKVFEKWAVSFLEKVKDRFKDEPHIYGRCMKLLCSLQNHSLCDRNDFLSDVLLEVPNLFHGHDDLIDELKFLITNTKCESPKDVRTSVGYEEDFNNFLRTVNLYNEEIVTKSELLELCTSFLGPFPELLRKFKDILGFKENGDNIEAIPMKIENKRSKSENGEDIDFSTVGRIGASYQVLPKDFVPLKCSGRTALCDEVLNDTWVCFPPCTKDSTFVASRKKQYEDVINSCEEERFELDMAISANSYTYQILENVQKKMNKMTAEEKRAFTLDDYLGGTSLVIQRNALHRCYGNKTEELIEGLKRNPLRSIPIVLKRLKVKEDEWKKSQKKFNLIWRSKVDNYSLKSLDHQRINFKQNDIKSFRPKSLLNEMEMVYAESKANQTNSKPHFVLEFKEMGVFLDAINLMLQCLKKLPGVCRDDRRKIELIIRSFIPDVFCVPRPTKVENELEIEEEIKGEPANDDGGERSGQSYAGSNKEEAEGSSEGDSNEDDLSDESSKAFIKKIDVFDKMDPLPVTNLPYTLFFVSKTWFVFFRQFYLLIERLSKLRHESNHKEAVARFQEEEPKPLYKELIQKLNQLLNGAIDYSKFEEEARSLFGIHAFVSFTLDKLVLSIVRQLQQVVTDDLCKECTAIFIQHTRKIFISGCASPLEASQIEYKYFRKVDRMIDDEKIFKIVWYKKVCVLTIELMDNNKSEGNHPESVEAEKLSNYLDNYLTEDTCCEELLTQVQLLPVFLSRNLRKQMLFWKNRVAQVEKQWHQKQSAKYVKNHLPLSARKRALSVIAPILRKKSKRSSIPEGNEPLKEIFEDEEEVGSKEELNKTFMGDQVIIKREENMVENQGLKQMFINEITEDTSIEEAEKMEIHEKISHASVVSSEKKDASIAEPGDASEDNISEKKTVDDILQEVFLITSGIYSDTDLISKVELTHNAMGNIKNVETESQSGNAIEMKQQLKRKTIQKTCGYSTKKKKSKINRTYVKQIKKSAPKSLNSSEGKQRRQEKYISEVLDDPTFDFKYFSELPEDHKISYLACKYTRIQVNDQVTFEDERFVQVRDLFLHRKDSLTRAREVHQAVSEIKTSNFNSWHKIWLDTCVTSPMFRYCNEWLVRGHPKKFWVTLITVNDCTKPPYYLYSKYKVYYYKKHKHA